MEDTAIPEVTRNKIEEFLKLVSGMEAATSESLSAFKYLCTVALHHPAPLPFAALADGLGVTESQISKVTRGVHVIGHKGAAGQNLIDIKFDLYSPKTKLVTLSKDGMKAIKATFGE